MMTDENICACRGELIGKLVTMVKLSAANKQYAYTVYLFCQTRNILIGKRNTSCLNI